ncbi:MAG TPA: hypothetical protein VNJ08_15545 [Bacteriovoracaceae bacterium]|nr:hypothetical protein [Bacteriovoracaceae bacterium]
MNAQFIKIKAKTGIISQSFRQLNDKVSAPWKVDDRGQVCDSKLLLDKVSFQS